jgi:hypothetical protein
MKEKGRNGGRKGKKERSKGRERHRDWRGGSSGSVPSKHKTEFKYSTTKKEKT